MEWLEKDNVSNSVGEAGAKRVEELNKARSEGLPVISKEAESGVKPFDPIKFQPVDSVGFYKGEFAIKGEDIIFHFWPWGFHEAQRANKPEPRFSRDFEPKLQQVLADVFGQGRCEVQFDEDMGSFFVKALGWGANTFARENAIKACTALHVALGGQI